MNKARVIGTALAGALLAGAALAQTDRAPEEAARPAERPELPVAPATASEPEAAPPPAEGAAAPAGPTPVPEPKPLEAEGATEAGAPAQAPVPAEAGEAPAQSPVPMETPEAPAEAPVPEEPADAPGTAPVPDPVPEPVPEPKDPETGAEAPEAAPAPDEPPAPELLAEDDTTLAACLGRLRALGTVFERADPMTEEGGACGIVNPLRVREIVPGVALEPDGLVRCAAAAALAEWVATFVLPASLLLPERGQLAAIQHGSTYICRGVGGGEDLSEHAFGNAVDVMAFRFAEGDPILVEPRERDGTAAEAFQRTARASACLIFTTVLGPGYNEAHADHLHLDIQARTSGHRLCG